MTPPLVSVVIPVYQRAGCVMDAVHSALAQTHRPVECIVVDDGSTDGSFDIVLAARASEPRLRVFAQAHRGVSAARNLGLHEAQGEFVTFLDSDDLMPPGRIARQLQLLREHSCDAIIGTQESSVAGDAPMPPWLAEHPEWHTGYYWTSVLVAAQQAKAVGGYDETLAVNEDLDFLVRLTGAGLRVEAVNEIFAVRRYFGDNLTYTVENPVSGLREVVRRHLQRRRASGNE